jgi:ketosteroid isomerase-like protein
LATSSRAIAADGQGLVRAEETAIRQASAAYIEALKRGDTKAATAFWIADGVYVDATGRSVKAPDLIQQQLGRATVPVKAGQVQVQSESSIRFVTSDVAIEEGTVQSDSTPDLDSSLGRFTAIWVRNESGWQLDSVRESPLLVRARGNRLNALAWMIGDWVGQGDGLVVTCSADWSESRNFMVRRFTVKRDTGKVLTGTQRIGWDPSARTIRSWVFDSEGGIVEGRWRQEGDSWVVKTTGVLPDGTQSSAVNFWVPEGDLRCVLKSSHVMVGNATIEDSVVEFQRRSDRR